MKLTVGAVVSPGTSKVNKTGNWRSFRPVVDRNLCSGCSICTYFCPDSSIEIVEKKCNINYDYCKGCGICAKECPQGAIKMEEERT
ncbi:4Fe-4S dicluster domain-containing protein [Thermoanaerobacteraceae bacterium SP2]|nr:4Fe-4S dicluster domain-containing protein [Thermoanaerobacteraceae bacterium SP2]